MQSFNHASLGSLIVYRSQLMAAEELADVADHTAG